MELENTDRALMIVSDATIHGTTRLQKYGFLLHKQYGQELSAILRSNPDVGFYGDWKPFWFGPFSESLSKDIQACVEAGLIYKELVDPARNSYRYSLTVRGRRRWRQLLSEFTSEITAIHEKVANLQGVRLERLLQRIYDAYPEYTKQSTIKDRLSGQS